jgi:hypothetical protein
MGAALCSVEPLCFRQKRDRRSIRRGGFTDLPDLAVSLYSCKLDGVSSLRGMRFNRCLELMDLKSVSLVIRAGKGRREHQKGNSCLFTG